MSASALPSTGTNSDNPTGAKRPKLESDEDEDISIVEEINVRPPQVADSNSQTAGPSQLSDGEAEDDNQDSKLAEFRNKMLSYQAEASRLRTQLKREQEKAQKAVAVREHYETKYEEERKRAKDAEAKATLAAQQKVTAAEKKAKDVQKQCERLETKVQSKEADIENRDKELANAAKDLNEAQKKAADAGKEAEDAKKKVTAAEHKAAEADAKKEAAEKEASNLKQELKELRKSKADAERTLNAKITGLEKRLTNTEASEQPSSSTDGQLAEGLGEANRRVAQQTNQIAKLRADKESLKKELTASKAKATRLESAQKKTVKENDDELRRLKKQIHEKDGKIRRHEKEIEKLEKLAYPALILDARLQTERLQQVVGRFVGISDKIMTKCDRGGVFLQSNPSRATLPKVQLELKPSFFDEFNCSEESLSQTEYSLLLKGFASQAGKEHCQISQLYNHVVVIQFKQADEEFYEPALALYTDDELEWTVIEEHTPYACTFEMNSFVLAQAAQKLSPVLLDFSNRGQPEVVVITDSEDCLGGGQREHLWRSLLGDTHHGNDFKAEFSSTTPDTHLRIFVDPKYLRRCVMASSGASSKTVEVSMSDDTLRLRYGNEHFSLTYYIPTVKPADGGERCYSPIEFGTEIFEI